MVGKRGEPTELYNLDKDIGEENDLAKTQADVLKRLDAAYEAWNVKNIAPVFESPKGGKKKKSPIESALE